MAALKKGMRITGTARAKLAADLKKKYEKGASIRALAESTGRSYGFVHRVLSEAGVTLRGRAASRGLPETNSSSRISASSTNATTDTSLPRLQRIEDWPVSIFLRDGSVAEGRRMRHAVRAVLEDIEFELDDEAEPAIGSFWQRARARSKDPVTRKAIRERLEKLERAAEVHLLAVPESQANMQNAQGVAAIIESLKGESAGVVQLGPLLIVKVPQPNGQSTILCRMMTPGELKKLERNPALLADPISLVAELPSFSEDSTVERAQ